MPPIDAKCAGRPPVKKEKRQKSRKYPRAQKKRRDATSSRPHDLKQTSAVRVDAPHRMVAARKLSSKIFKNLHEMPTIGGNHEMGRPARTVTVARAVAARNDAHRWPSSDGRGLAMPVGECGSADDIRRIRDFENHAPPREFEHSAQRKRAVSSGGMSSDAREKSATPLAACARADDVRKMRDFENHAPPREFERPA
ncbi:hypothetical protein PLICRDRAFT_178007 [Plicaturopsis crispa FD-325 SS-3]|nr:hypothetical protein PLICRDRAFT_178007 [Plicaturopsis crispa FD-325 SS-3]